MNASTSSQNLAIGEHDFETNHVIACHTVFQATRTTGVCGDVSANGAILHARRIRRIKQFLRAHRRFELSGKHAWFNNSNGVDKVDLLDAVHARERERDPAARRHTSAHVTKSASAGGDWNFFARGELKELANVGR